MAGWWSSRKQTAATSLARMSGTAAPAVELPASSSTLTKGAKSAVPHSAQSAEREVSEMEAEDDRGVAKKLEFSPAAAFGVKLRPPQPVLPAQGGGDEEVNTESSWEEAADSPTPLAGVGGEARTEDAENSGGGADSDTDDLLQEAQVVRRRELGAREIGFCSRMFVSVWMSE